MDFWAAIKEWLNGSGVVIHRERFISVGHIEDALQKKFLIRIVKDTPHFIQCKVIRLGRFCGFPWIWPHPTLSISLNRENDYTTLYYKFYWPEYYVSLFYGIFVFIIYTIFNYYNLGLKVILTGFLFSSIVFIFVSLFIFLDARYLSWRIRIILQKV